MNATSGRVADSTGNWVDGLAPGWTRPYLRLARFDRPIGAWLLLLPCWWSAGLAAIAARAAMPNLVHIALFFVGAFVMRGAGCTWNDIVDRNLDARVERTRSRPIPSGQVSVAQAAAFLVAQALVGLLVLVQLNRFAIMTGIASLAIVAVYPFMKRITYWPQIVLGLAFSCWSSPRVTGVDILVDFPTTTPPRERVQDVSLAPRATRRHSSRASSLRAELPQAGVAVASTIV